VKLINYSVTELILALCLHLNFPIIHFLKDYPISILCCCYYYVSLSKLFPRKSKCNITILEHTQLTVRFRSSLGRWQL